MNQSNLYIILLLLLGSIQGHAQDSEPVMGKIMVIETRSHCTEGRECEFYSLDSNYVDDLSYDTVYFLGDQLLHLKARDRWGFEDKTFVIYPTKASDTLTYGGTSPFLNYFSITGPNMATWGREIWNDEEYRRKGTKEIEGDFVVQGLSCKKVKVFGYGRAFFAYYTTKFEGDERLPILPDWQAEASEIIPGMVLKYEEDPRIYPGWSGWWRSTAAIYFKDTLLSPALFQVPKSYTDLTYPRDSTRITPKDLYLFNRIKASVSLLEKEPRTEKEEENYLGHWFYEEKSHKTLKTIFRVEEEGKKKIKVTTRTLHNLHIGEGTRSTLDAYFIDHDLLVDNWIQFLHVDPALPNELILKTENNQIMKPITEEEAKEFIRLNDLIRKVDKMEDSLKEWGYSKIFELKGGALSEALYADPDNLEILIALARTNYMDRLACFLACEIILRNGGMIPDQTDHMRVHIADSYVFALTASRTPSTENWATLHGKEPILGICGKHLLLFTNQALEELKRPVHQSFDFYHDYDESDGSRIARNHGVRIKDIAHFFICQIIEYPYEFLPEKEDRDKAIDEIWIMINHV